MFKVWTAMLWGVWWESVIQVLADLQMKRKCDSSKNGLSETATETKDVLRNYSDFKYSVTELSRNNANLIEQNITSTSNIATEAPLSVRV